MTCAGCPYHAVTACQSYCVADGRAVPLLMVAECLREARA